MELMYLDNVAMFIKISQWNGIWWEVIASDLYVTKWTFV